MTDYGRQIGPGSLEFNRHFDADIETVWQFLVDPEKRKLWFCGGRTDDHVGGKIVFDFDHSRLSDSKPPEKYAGEDTATHHGEITQFDPPHLFAFTWFESAGAEASTVEIALTEAGEGGTELHLVHHGVAGRDMLIGVFAGWHGHFDLMREVMAGPRKTDFWIRDAELEEEYDERL